MENEYKFITMHNIKFLVMKTGLIARKLKGGRWKLFENKTLDKDGYILVGIGKILYRLHRIIAFVSLNLDIKNPKLMIDHIDGNVKNNNINNLRIVSNKQNQWNQTKAKGYSWYKRDQNWRARIRVSGELIYLGNFPTEEEARQAYLNAKLIYHKIE